MSAPVYAALERALDSCDLLDGDDLTLEAWADWVRNTDTLTAEEKDLVLNAGADEYRVYANHAGTAAQARLDQSDARVASIDEALAALAPYRVDGTETIRTLLIRLNEDSEVEHARVRALLDSAFPTGTVSIEVIE